MKKVIDQLVIANRILANEGVVDAYGHVSVRHPDDPQRFFLARSHSPDQVRQEDIMDFRLDGTPGILFRDRVQRVALRRRRVLADIDGLTSRLPQRLVRSWLELDGFLVMVQRIRRVHRRVVTIADGDVVGRRLCGDGGGKRV